jgi:hypothetical protein
VHLYLGNLLLEFGDTRLAAEQYRLDLALFRKLGSLNEIGLALGNLGLVHHIESSPTTWCSGATLP